MAENGQVVAVYTSVFIVKRGRRPRVKKTCSIDAVVLFCGVEVIAFFFFFFLTTYRLTKTLLISKVM